MQEREQKPFAEVKGLVALFQWWAAVQAALLEVWVTKFGTWGDRYMGVRGVLALGWLWVFTAFCQDPAGMKLVLWFFYATIALLLVHRVKGIILRRRGYDCHSMYVGDRRFSNPSGVCFLAGIGLMPFSYALGLYVFLGSLAMAVNQDFMRLRDRARVRAINDARYESEYYAAQLKEDGR